METNDFTPRNTYFTLLVKKTEDRQELALKLDLLSKMVDLLQSSLNLDLEKSSQTNDLKDNEADVKSSRKYHQTAHLSEMIHQLVAKR